jgi:hypothetical protein
MAIPKTVVDLIERFNRMVYNLYALARSSPLDSCLNPLKGYTVDHAYQTDYPQL